ncbi:hypothetical protein [Trujillonella endophytica]|uniref:Uncharacterized protein n=1 Tax=Trujillonella endophytica TaxID=673521 RepID=A0A1H8W527_9ACTN|nr:hypothetical protein [Trujillella endophytica]SEP22709.1 hypothetical protein SAMN05660991_04070 [Trujillella endophytica]
MTWLWLVLLGWLVIAVLAGLLIGGVVHVADRRDGSTRGSRVRSPLARPSAEDLLSPTLGGNRAG